MPGMRTETIASVCSDCGTDTTPCTGKRGCRHKGRWEYYMIRDAIWAACGMKDGFLCIGCIEARLGRQLASRDFVKVPINGPSSWDTPRLAERKARKAAIRPRNGPTD
jgi:hypothetical protein